jgi:hypothetical protein
MEVSSLIQAPVALSLEKQHHVRTEWESGWDAELVWAWWQREREQQDVHIFSKYVLCDFV